MPVAIVLVWEALSFPATPSPFPPRIHPAFAWLRDYGALDATIVDLTSPLPDVLNLAIRGETLYATTLHGHATVAGAGSVWPAHTQYLLDWFWSHPRPHDEPELVPLLRGYGARYILLHEDGFGGWREKLSSVPELAMIECFAPPPDRSPWPWDICIWEIEPTTTEIGLDLREGWSAPEPWGVWAEGTRSHARWLATNRRDHLLELEAFPLCVPDRSQSIAVSLNGFPVETLLWQGCDTVDYEVMLPADLIDIGWNELAFDYGYAEQPSALSDGASPDARRLAVGYNRLHVGYGPKRQ
jgi:hypothetical protein